jgi:hypothetical protein
MLDRHVEPLAYDRKGAADALSVSLRHFQEHVQGDLPVVYVGGKRIYPRRHLERWIDDNACVGGKPR